MKVNDNDIILPSFIHFTHNEKHLERSMNEFISSSTDEELNNLLNEPERYYNFIHDEKEIKKFYDLFYRDTFGEDSSIVYIISMSFRCKYSTKHLERNNRVSDSMLARKIIKEDDYEKFLKSLKQYNYEIDEDLPQECGVLYATLNPRSTFKALVEFTERMNKWMYNTITTKVMDKSIKNIYSIIKSCIQNQSHQQKYIQLDLDNKDDAYIEMVKEFCEEHHITPKCVIETRGGYHYIIDSTQLTNQQKKEIFTGQLKQLKYDGFDRNGKAITKNVIDIISHTPMSPIPGTYQGGFPVRFVP
jgi:hypothetical protein